jgi:hypothetical protein
MGGGKGEGEGEIIAQQMLADSNMVWTLEL